MLWLLTRQLYRFASKLVLERNCIRDECAGVRFQTLPYCVRCIHDLALLHWLEANYGEEVKDIEEWYPGV